MVAGAGATREEWDVSVRLRGKVMRRRGKVMRLHLVRGSFSTAAAASNAVVAVDDVDAGAAGEGGACCVPVMDAAVWSKLPEKMVWRVLRFVPPAKLFQLHSVSRKWRQVLTSSRFRSSIATAATTSAAAGAHVTPPPPQEQQQQRVLACVTTTPDGARVRDMATTLSSSNALSMMTKMNLREPPPNSPSTSRPVDIDLSFVPDWFWTPPEWSPLWAPQSPDYCPYTVVAAGDGLLCISNNRDLVESRENPQPAAAASGSSNRYCVLNPLTRTCVVLPRVPFTPWGWLPLTSGRVTIYGADQVPGKRMWPWGVATYDLAAGGNGEWVLAAPSGRPLEDHPWISAPAVFGGGGESYWYHDGLVHVLGPGMAEGTLVEAAPAVAAPVAEAARMQSLDPASPKCRDFYLTGNAVFLAAHAGAVFFVTRTLPRDGRTQLPCGVWRRRRVAKEARGGREDPAAAEGWTEVARLEARDVERLTGWTGEEQQQRRGRAALVERVREVMVAREYGAAREMLCVRGRGRRATGPICFYVRQRVTRIRPTGRWFTLVMSLIIRLEI